MSTYYDLLKVPASASAEEIKRAFRGQIARYHPDKLQHLGAEFQELAASRSAELTRAYEVLSDAASRLAYDRQIEAEAREAASTRRMAQSARREGPPGSGPDTARAGADGPRREPALPTHDPRLPPGFLRKAAVERLRDALGAEGLDVLPAPASGFDVTAIAPRKAIFQRTAPSPVTVVGRFVERVDRSAIAHSWRMAAAVPADPGAVRCAFLLAPELASRLELGGAIADERRRASGAQVVIIPLEVIGWNALMPSDAPAVVRSLASRLRQASGTV